MIRPSKNSFRSFLSEAICAEYGGGLFVSNDCFALESEGALFVLAAGKGKMSDGIQAVAVGNTEDLCPERGSLRQ